MADDPVSFESPEKEIKYWKEETLRLREVVVDVQDELQEFRECSEEIEKELESQLEQNEKQLKDLNQKNNSLTFECENLTERYEKLQGDSFRQVNDLQDQISKLTVSNSEYSKDIRVLEQQNDDLERTNRNIFVSLNDFQQRLNQALERNAFLECELDEKSEFSITIQRLKDETRDLQHELSLRKRKVSETRSHENKETPVKSETKAHSTASATPSAVSTKKVANGIHTPKQSLHSSLPETPKGPQKCLHFNGERTPLTPSARMSALSIVGDLLRKVSYPLQPPQFSFDLSPKIVSKRTLESKLSSCRNFVHEQPAKKPHNSPSMESPKEANGLKPVVMKMKL